MPSSTVIEIIIKAIDNATKTTENIQKKTQQMANTQKAITKEIDNTKNKYNTLSTTANSTFSTINNKIRSAITETNTYKTITTSVGTAYKTMSNAVNSTFNKINSTIEASKRKIKSLGSTFTDNNPRVNSLAETIKTKLGSSVDVFKSKLKSIPATFSNVSSTANSKLNSIKNTGSNVASNIKSTFTNAFSVIGNIAKSAGSSISASFTSANERIRAALASSIAKTREFQTVSTSTSMTAKSSMQNMWAYYNKCATEAELLAQKQSTLGMAFTAMGDKARAAFNKISTGVTTASTKLTALRMKVGMVGSAFATAFGMIGLHSIEQMTVGAALAKEKLQATMSVTLGSTAAVQDLYNTMKPLTENSPIGLQSLATAMNSIKVKTGMSNEELKKCSSTVEELGELTIAMGGSTEDATTIMSSAYMGLNGNFRQLKQQFGITKEKMMQMGWSGQANDIEGYNAALKKCIEKNGNFKNASNSTAYQMALVKKNFQSAGLAIGMALLPALNTMAHVLNTVTQKCPLLVTGLVIIAGAIAVVTALAMPLAAMIEIWEAIKDSELLAAIATKAWSVATKLAAAAQWLLNLAMDANPIGIVIIAIAALVAILIYFYTTNEGVRNSINGIGTAIMTAIGGAFAWLQGALNNTVLWITTTINKIKLTINFIIVFLQMLPATIGMYLTMIVLNIVARGAQMVAHARNIGSRVLTGFVTFISRLPSRIASYLIYTVSRFVMYGASMVARARSAASRIVTGFVTYISRLPSRVATYLSNVVSRIISYGTRMVTNAKNAASRLVTQFIQKVKELPGKVAQEMVHIAENIIKSIPRMVEAAQKAAGEMVNKFLDKLESHSPGKMARTIEREMGYIAENLEDAKNPLRDMAGKVAENMVTGFGNVDLNKQVTTPEVPQSMQNVPTTPISSAVNTAQNVTQKITPMIDTSKTAVQNGNNTVNPNLSNLLMGTGTGNINTGMTANTAAVTNASNQISAAVNTNTTKINQNLLNTQQKLNTLTTASTKNKTAVTLNNTQTTSSFNKMQKNVTTDLNNIKTKNTAAWNNVKSTTTSNLKSIQSSTKNVTTSMVDAWHSMKNGIVQSAQNIKSQSTTHFNNLSSTIRTFYHHLQNPGGWGTPTTPTHLNTSSTHSFGNIGNALSSSINAVNGAGSTTQKVLTRGDIILNNCVSGDCLDYSTPQYGHTTMQDLILGNCVNCIDPDFENKAAGWLETAQPNNRYIKQTTDKWNMKGPVIIGKYDTGVNFKVSQFENGTPNISFGLFETMMEHVFDQCHYEFYWDSAKYGNWQTAFQNGGMNCSDSTDALVAMAHACGLSAEKVHGHWGNFGHYWANVAGQKMDTTGWMLHRTWTPSKSHAGPAPIDLSNNNSNDSSIEHTGTITINVEHHIIGTLPNNISKQEVEAMMNAQPEDNAYIKSIVTNQYFQDLDQKIKDKNKKKIQRNRGK